MSILYICGKANLAYKAKTSMYKNIFNKIKEIFQKNKNEVMAIKKH